VDERVDDRVDELATVRAIEQVKYRYLRALDLKQWDEYADTLTEDVDARYGDRLSFTGRDDLVAYLRAAVGPGVITVHHCHHPEISVAGGTATATWALQDTVIVVEHRMLIRGAAFYDDAYRRGDDGRWRISRTGYARTYESVEPLPEGWQLTANRFAG
jgi:ketosteroid isomerase-like protein